MSKSLILASASPTRGRLLAAAGVDFRLEPALLNEQVIKEAFRSDGRTPVDCGLALAEAKAMEVAARRPNALIIGADQILVCDRIWFDKPTTLDEARAQLRVLRGRTHELVTAVCVVQDGARTWHAESSAKLTMRQFSDAFLDAYLGAEGTAVLGSVGGYRLEGRGIQLFAHINGDHFAILGLPLLDLVGFLRDRGMLAS